MNVLDFETPDKIAKSIAMSTTPDSSGKDILQRYRDAVAKKSAERLTRKLTDIDTTNENKSSNNLDVNLSYKQNRKDNDTQKVIKFQPSEENPKKGHIQIFNDDKENRPSKHVNISGRFIKAAFGQRKALNSRSINISNVNQDENKNKLSKPTILKKSAAATASLPIVTEKTANTVKESTKDVKEDSNEKIPNSTNIEKKDNDGIISPIYDSTSGVQPNHENFRYDVSSPESISFSLSSRASVYSNDSSGYSPRNFSAMEKDLSIWAFAETGTDGLDIDSHDSESNYSEMDPVTPSKSLSTSPHPESPLTSNSARTFSTGGRSDGIANSFKSVVSPSSPNAESSVHSHESNAMKSTTFDTPGTLVPNEVIHNSECRSPSTKYQSNDEYKSALSLESKKKSTNVASNERNHLQIIIDDLRSELALEKKAREKNKLEIEELRAMVKASGGIKNSNHDVSPASKVIALGLHESQPALGTTESAAMSLIERNKTLVKEVRFADQTCVELSERNAAMQRDVHRLEKEISHVKIENEHMHDAVVRATKHSAEMEEKATKINMQLQITKERYEHEIQGLSDESSKFKKKLTDVNALLEKGEQEIKSLRDDLSTTKAKYDVLVDEHTFAKDQITTLVARLAAAQSSLDKDSVVAVDTFKAICIELQEKMERLQSIADKRFSGAPNQNDLQMKMSEEKRSLHMSYEERIQCLKDTVQESNEMSKSMSPSTRNTIKMDSARTPTSTVLAKTLQNELNRGHDAFERILESERIISITQLKLKEVSQALEQSKANENRLQLQLESFLKTHALNNSTPLDGMPADHNTTKEEIMLEGEYYDESKYDIEAILAYANIMYEESDVAKTADFDQLLIVVMCLTRALSFVLEMKHHHQPLHYSETSESNKSISLCMMEEGSSYQVSIPTGIAYDTSIYTIDSKTAETTPDFRFNLNKARRILHQLKCSNLIDDKNISEFDKMSSSDYASDQESTECDFSFKEYVKIVTQLQTNLNHYEDMIFAYEDRNLMEWEDLSLPSKYELILTRFIEFIHDKANFEDTLKEKQNFMEMLKKELLSLERRINDKDKEIDYYVEESSSLKEDLFRQAEEISLMNSRFTLLEDEKNKLSSSLHDYNTEIEWLQSSLKSSEANMNQILHENAGLVKKYNDLSQETSKNHQAFLEETQKRLTVEKKIEEYERERERNLEKLDRIQGTLKTNEEKLANYTRRLEEADQLISNLKEDYLKVEQVCKQNAEEHKTELEFQKKVVEETKETLLHLEREYEKNLQELRTAEATKKEIEESLTKSSSIIQELEGENKNLDEKCGMMRAYVKKLTKKCDEWKLSYEEQQRILIESTTERDQAMDHIASLNTKIQHLESSQGVVAVSSPSSECRYLRKAIRNECIRVSKLTNEIEKKEECILNLKQAIKHSTDEVPAIESPTNSTAWKNLEHKPLGQGTAVFNDCVKSNNIKIISSHLA